MKNDKAMPLQGQAKNQEHLVKFSNFEITSNPSNLSNLKFSSN